MTDLAKKWGHDELARDLADFLDQDLIVLLNTQMGKSGSIRPDVFSMVKTYNRRRVQATTYEIKVTLEDLNRDITAGKSRAYYDFSQRVYYCYPRELQVDPMSIPSDFGIMVRGPEKWRTARKCVMHDLPEYSPDLWMKLLMAAWDTLPRGTRDRLDASEAAYERLNTAMSEDLKQWRHSRERCQRELENLERMVEQEKEDLAKLRADSKQLRDELTEEFGRTPTRYHTIDSIRESILDELTPETQRRRLDTRLNEAQKAIQALQKVLPT